MFLVLVTVPVCCNISLSDLTADAASSQEQRPDGQQHTAFNQVVI